MHSAEPALTMSSETRPSSTANSVSFSRFRPPYLIGIASAGMYLRRAIYLLRFYIIFAIDIQLRLEGREERAYLRRVSVTFAGRAKTNLLLVLWVKNGERIALNAQYQKGTLTKIYNQKLGKIKGNIALSETYISKPIIIISLSQLNKNYKSHFNQLVLYCIAACFDVEFK